MAKSIPPSVKHLNCQCKVVQGNFGPHKAKIVCTDHNDTFVQWVSNEYFNEDWPEPNDEFLVEISKFKVKSNLYKNGDVFDKLKYSDAAPNDWAIEILKKLRKSL